MDSASWCAWLEGVAGLARPVDLSGAGAKWALSLEAGPEGLCGLLCVRHRGPNPKARGPDRPAEDRAGPQGQALREFGLCQGRVSNSERVNKEIETERQWGCEGRSGKHLCPLLVDKCPTQSYCVLLSNWSTQWWVRAGCPPRQKWVFQELEIIIVWDTLKIHVWYTLYIAVL